MRGPQCEVALDIAPLCRGLELQCLAMHLLSSPLALAMASCSALEMHLHASPWALAMALAWPLLWPCLILCPCYGLAVLALVMALSPCMVKRISVSTDLLALADQMGKKLVIARKKKSA